MELSPKLLLTGACVLALIGCSPAPVDRPYSRTGELLALSGGDGGPQAACHICHGMQGEGDGDLTPRLAGIERGYLTRQMNFFADGLRNHAQMHWIAKRLTPAEQELVAGYYADMAFQAPPAPASTTCDARAAAIYHQGDPARGMASCASCHGDAGEGIGRGNPAIAGQPARYIAHQLTQWREGKRYGDPQGAMLAAARLLREDEIEAVAVYSASLRGSPGDPGSPAECPPPHRPDR
ncbi:c-type cytochrome [Altererythrobacter xixiisoli]|uniref:C-type cytochrome n=1 Tax=Croceibacterium xixiisoli TaxID=1476466 RepID=A0A6I4TQZ5_9SPHN|nr:c-type cytochrome [Croceibacterium xixiisoli]MXO98322.1 c-type cytochrome [Croceibacterium xixiisoli]